MKIVVAIDSFKGSISSIEAGNAIKKGILKHNKNHQVVVKGVADGGEGTVQTLIESLNGQYKTVTICNPDGIYQDSYYGIVENKVIIEVALASGIMMTKNKNPLKATSYGLGEMIKDALNNGYRHFIIGLGGSATNDGGMGMLEALGYRFYDENHQLLKGNGENLIKIAYIDESCRLPELKDCHFNIASDVNAILCGQNGASVIFGPQKGADEYTVKLLDQGLYHYADVICCQLKKKDERNILGAGAAGGLGYCFKTFFDSQITPGLSLVNKITHLEDELRDADVVFTGEGRIDCQTKLNKVPFAISQLAKKYHCRTIALAGQIEKEAYELNELGIDALFSVIQGVVTLDEAMESENTKRNLENTAYQIMSILGGTYESCSN